MKKTVLAIFILISSISFLKAQHQLEKKITKLNDNSYLIEEVDSENRVIISGKLISVEPEVKSGEFKFFNEKGQLEAEGVYKQNLPIGIWKYYNKKGKVIKEINYDRTIDFLQNDSTYNLAEVPAILENMPTFKGKEKSYFGTYIKENLNYPIYALKKNITDRVFVQFVICIDGSVRSLKIISSSGNLDLNMEALRIISESPKWKPGSTNGKPYPLSVTYHVVFNTP